MKFLSSAAFAAFVLVSTPANAITVHTAPFLSAATNITGFETMTGGTEFTDAGMTITYVGYAPSIWLTSQAYEGVQSWYPDAGGFGYTRIRFDTVVDSFQFAAGSGWQTGTPSLQFQLLLEGDLVFEGAIDAIPNYTGFSIYGFSGAGFDEVHLQSQISYPGQFRSVDGQGTVPEFDEGAYDALTLDAFAFGGPIDPPVIPEPATWALLIAGFGLVGASLRRARQASASA
ncbi:MAG: PEPxxWA-CTERM sorting domain-containing protein [Sandaracinobacteroides sp.]